MDFRKYLKCQKKEKDRAIYGSKKMSQLWTEEGMGFREYIKCQKKEKDGAIYGAKENEPTMD
jgi:hypothetical protein